MTVRIMELFPRHPATEIKSVYKQFRVHNRPPVLKYSELCYPSSHTPKLGSRPNEWNCSRPRKLRWIWANGSEVPIPQLNQTYHDAAGTRQSRSQCLNSTIFSKCGKDTVLRAEHIGIIVFILENFSFLYGSTSWSDVTVEDSCYSLDIGRYKLCQNLLKKSLSLCTGTSLNKP